MQNQKKPAKDKITRASDRASHAIAKAIRQLQKSTGMDLAAIDVYMKRDWPVCLSLVRRS